jgi:hypothetical protein
LLNTNFLWLSFSLVYNLKLSEDHRPQVFIASSEDASGQAARAEGSPALKLWPPSGRTPTGPENPFPSIIHVTVYVYRFEDRFRVQ